MISRANYRKHLQRIHLNLKNKNYNINNYKGKCSNSKGDKNEKFSKKRNNKLINVKGKNVLIEKKNIKDINFNTEVVNENKENNNDKLNGFDTLSVSVNEIDLTKSIFKYLGDSDSFIESKKMKKNPVLLLVIITLILQMMKILNYFIKLELCRNQLFIATKRKMTIIINKSI